MRRVAQVLGKTAVCAVARAAPAPLAPASRAAMAVAPTHNTRARCFATFPGDDKPALDIDHATGLELKELQALAEGKDFFDHYAFLKAPNGTKEAPVVVTSSMPYRIVGATDPDDDSIVHWGRVEAGKPPIKIGEEWFVHKAE